MTSQPLVSVVCPAYNAGKYIGETIRSVFAQTYTNWELLIVDDGSTDNTAGVVAGFSDGRIRFFQQENRGVGAARNLALRQMKGAYFCFLDADDVYPPRSIEARLEVFGQDAAVDFVDGCVQFRNEDLGTVLKRHEPGFKGAPFDRLMRMDEAVLFGNTWMVRRKEGIDYRFDTSLKYSEDLFFYLTITQEGGLFSFTREDVLWYRRHTASAMSDIDALGRGYQALFRLVRARLNPPRRQLQFLRYRIVRIMFATYLKGERKPLRAIRSAWENFRM